ncbi:hypothetical protein [Lactiplantibacillus plantarum]|uniref:hypothetical protein n=1 Tax=Lactiplantibacillus plantarum TaxID=1590 RepID=UPI000B1166CB|nr:hypothetical protein [Lactiplantibacillus plantarum]MCG0834596.1 hypothetical protein [Lactiplantibacillus plantarum]WKF78306.1 hypothetical protein QY877_11600 [Lactiplantibacillus plantarum]BEI48738.1 hypothetical protein AWA2013_01440 [Lactiplantibacillus plantarum]
MTTKRNTKSNVSTSQVMNEKDLIKVIGGRKKSSKVLSNILKCLWNGVGRA